MFLLFKVNNKPKYQVSQRLKLSFFKVYLQSFSVCLHNTCGHILAITVEPKPSGPLLSSSLHDSNLFYKYKLINQSNIKIVNENLFGGGEKTHPKRQTIPATIQTNPLHCLLVLVVMLALQ